MLTRVSDARQFVVAELDSTGEVIALEEKPKQPKSDLALVGVYIFTPAVHEAVRHLEPSGRGELEITEAIQWVLESIEPLVSGSVDDASELIGRVVIEAGAQVRGSRIVGPVIIGTGTRVFGSYIGPFTSVAHDCVISGSEIEYSIVMGGASIPGVRRIQASIIGRDVEVTPSPRVPRAHRLVLGDNSKVQISS